MKRPLSHTETKIMLVDYLAQKTIEFAQPNGGQVVVVTVGGQNAWEQGKILYLQSNNDRFRDYFTYLTYYSQSYNILLTHKFSSWLSDIIQFLSPVQAGTFKKLFFRQFFVQ